MLGVESMTNQGLCGALKQYWTIEEKPRLTRRNAYFEDKRRVMGKINSLLSSKGLLCLSIDKNQSEWIDMGSRRIRVFPDTPESITAFAGQAGLKTKKINEIENAYLITIVK